MAEFLRVGIVSTLPERPLVNLFECFDIQGPNGSEIIPNFNSLRCNNLPGYSIDFLYLLKDLLFPKSEIKFVPASGWTHIADGTGLIDIGGSGQVDLTVAQLWMKHRRLAYTDFTLPVTEIPPNCFLVCGGHNLHSHKIGGVFSLLFSRMFGLLLLAIVLSMLLFQLCKRRLSQPECPAMDFWPLMGRFASQLYHNIRCVKNHEGNSILALEFCVFFSFLTVLEGIFKGQVLNEFKPARKFPFRSLAELAESVSSKRTDMCFEAKTSSVYTDLLHDDALAILKEALEHNPPVFVPLYELGSDVEKCVVRHVGTQVQDFFVEARKFGGVDCQCKVFGRGARTLVASSIPKNSSDQFRENINVAILELAAFGLTNRLQQKYRIVSGRPDLIDSNPGLSDDEVVKIALPMLFGSIIVLLAAHFCGFIVLLLEIYSRNHHKTDGRKKSSNWDFSRERALEFKAWDLTDSKWLL